MDALPRQIQSFARFAMVAAAVLLAGGLTAQAEESAMPADLKLEPIQVGKPERLEVFPATIQIDAHRSDVRVVVTAHYADGRVQDVTGVAKLKSANDKVAVIEGERIVAPRSNGETTVSVQVGKSTIDVPCVVQRFEQPHPYSFQFETLVALSKQGCNQGACHGSPSGKGGFRLSLRAYDPVLDEETLIREAFNRRTNVQEPEKSLLLQKPLMEVAHGGGRKLAVEDPSYDVLKGWIAEGLKVDPADAPTCEKVEVYPRDRVLNWPAHTQQISVIAHFSDGTVRDVTPLAVFSSSDEGVATVDESGFVAASGRGETAILVRYLEKMETAYLMFLKDVPGFARNDPASRNYVDEAVFSKLQTLQILPSEPCSDSEFLRRVYLDTLGVLPTVPETEAFLKNESPAKRAELIDELLERPQFADFWGLKWADLLRVNNKNMSTAGVHKFHRWIVAAIRDNMPYDQFVEQLLTSQGSTFANPPANYFRAATDTNDCVETTSQIFLGIRIQCAKCHNHPFERWTQDNYYGIGAFFNRVQRKKTATPDEMVVFMGRSGEVTQPRTGEQMKPWLPLAGSVDVPGDEDRREVFVDWLRGKENPLFAQAAVNRIWGHLMGRGIVEPVDDFRASNPPSNERLIQALAKDFIESGFDRKHIIRTILNSQTYQLSSKKNDLNASDTKYFSHSGTRMLSAEQLLDAICQVTDVQETYAGLPDGTKATQLPSPDVNNYFLKVFGQPAREMACQCERSSDSNLSQALQMINGPLVHGKLRSEGVRFRKLIADGKQDDEIVRQIYLSALCREPSEQELTAAVKHIGAQEQRELGLEDVCWAVLNAKEFLFQH